MTGGHFTGIFLYSYNTVNIKDHSFQNKVKNIGFIPVPLKHGLPLHLLPNLLMEKLKSCKGL